MKATIVNPSRSPHAVQRAALAERCTADAGAPVALVAKATGVPGLQRIDFVLRCARDKRSKG